MLESPSMAMSAFFMLGGGFACVCLPSYCLSSAFFHARGLWRLLFCAFSLNVGGHLTLSFFFLEGGGGLRGHFFFSRSNDYDYQATMGAGAGGERWRSCVCGLVEKKTPARANPSADL